MLGRIIFLNHFTCPFYSDLSKPDRFKFNLRNWRSFKIKSVDGKSEIGAWQILHHDIESDEQFDAESFTRAFSDGSPIMIYYHGISMNRGCKHRVELYHLFRQCGLNILAIDYRGFGDSSGSIHSGEHMVEDAQLVLNYVRQNAPRSSLFLWGHSLGTGVVSSLLSKVSETEIESSIGGVFLEAPFTSLIDTMDQIFHTIPWRFMPYFDRVFKQSLISMKLAFNSVENLRGINIPIMILHAEDDVIISYKMGLKLFANQKETNKNVFAKVFPTKDGYGHKWIVRYPGLPALISAFTERCVLWKTDKIPIDLEMDRL